MKASSLLVLSAWKRLESSLFLVALARVGGWQRAPFYDLALQGQVVARVGTD